MLEIVKYSAPTHGLAVERFNAKLAAGGSEFRFPLEEPKAKDGAESVWLEHFVATESGEIFGGYILKHQNFLMNGAVVTLDNLQLPISLGLVDKRFAHVSVALLFDALGHNELLYCLGMGSQDSKLVKFLTAAGWQHQVTPFFFRILAANRFARNIQLPSERAWLQVSLRMAGALRIAGLADWVLKLMRPTQGRNDDTKVQMVPRFDKVADDLFAEGAGTYALIGDRRSHVLNSWYPENNRSYQRLLMSDSGKAVGWALVLDTQMKSHKYFGNLRVGTLADGFAKTGKAAAVAQAADRFLAERGVDLIVSNQLHPEWQAGLTEIGYRRGPSNFFFYYSRDLADLLSRLPDWERRLHINRGDGDGPIHL